MGRRRIQQNRLEPMTYARSRLCLGISGVGLQVVLSIASLWFGLPHRLLRGLSDSAAISLTLLCFICISIPCDVIGGYYLPRQHKRTQIRPHIFFAAWIRGVLSQALIMVACAVALLEAGRWGGTGAGIACFTLLMLVLLAAQSMLARLVGGLTTMSRGIDPDAVKDPADAAFRLPSAFFRSSDPGFVGGLVGFPTAERLIVPDAWHRTLPSDVVATELTRRRGVIATGARTRGLLVAITCTDYINVVVIF